MRIDIEFCEKRIKEQNEYIDKIVSGSKTPERKQELIDSAHQVKMRFKRVLSALLKNK